MGDSLNLHFRQSGPENGPPLIFLHGLFASLQNWQSVTKRISSHFNIVNVDLPNHGYSPHTKKFSFVESTHAVLDLMDSLEIASAHLVGHSLGGKIAMLVAMQNPERVKSLLVEDIAPKSYPPWFSFAMRAMQNLNLKTLSSRKEADEFLSEHIFEKELRAFLLTNLQRDGDDFKWRIHLDALIAGGVEISSFPKTEGVFLGKTLFIRGEKSPYVQPEDSTLIKTHFPKANIETFQGADHWVHARCTEKFTERLLAFIS